MLSHIWKLSRISAEVSVETFFTISGAFAYDQLESMFKDSDIFSSPALNIWWPSGVDVLKDQDKSSSELIKRLADPRRWVKLFPSDELISSRYLSTAGSGTSVYMTVRSKLNYGTFSKYCERFTFCHRTRGIVIYLHDIPSPVHFRH